MRKKNIKKQIWIDAKEDEVLKKKSKQAGLSESEFIRSLVKGYRIKEQPTEEIKIFQRRNKMETNEVKQTIIRLYFEEHQRPKEIAPIICKTPQYVSKIVTKDKRYKNEKNYKKKQSLEKKKAYNREYYKTYVRNANEKENREEYYKLLATIDKDNKILSTKTELSDIDFAKWNRSIFEYAKNSSNLVLKKGIKVTSDVPRVVSNIVHASSIRSSRVYLN